MHAQLLFMKKINCFGLKKNMYIWNNVRGTEKLVQEAGRDRYRIFNVLLMEHVPMSNACPDCMSTCVGEWECNYVAWIN